MLKSALIFGIDHYKVDPLTTCVNDAKAMTQLLERHEDGSLNFSCSTWTSDIYKMLGKDFLIQKMEKFFQLDVEFALLFFAGHGTRVDGQGYMVPMKSGFTKGAPIDPQKFIAFEDILTMTAKSRIKNIAIILDCCYSGAFSQQNESKGNGYSIARIRDGVSILTASDEDEFSVGRNGRGVFSKLLTDGLQGEAADLLGQISISSLYSYTEKLLGIWEQRPEFKANIERGAILRKTKPQIPLEYLQKLTHFFQDTEDIIQLDPQYEDALDQSNPQKASEFKILQRMRNSYLLEPINEQDMYYAAQNSDAIRLTTKGKFYWRMVKNKKI